ncbi:hypothetical protein KCV06_g561, partial [Aureobasidium melanogenum]
MLDKRASITVVGFLRVVCFGYHFLLFARSWCAFQFTTNFCAIISSDCRPNRKCLLDYKLQANAHLLYSDPPLTRAQCEDYISRHGVDEAEPVLVVGVGTLRSGLNQFTNGKEQEEGAKEGAARPKQNCQVS